MAEVEIDALSLEISSDTKAAESSLDSLIGKLKELKKECNMADVTSGVQQGMEGVQEVAQEAQEASESTKEMGKGAQLGAAGLAILGSGAVLAVNGLIKIKEGIEKVTHLVGKMLIMKAFRAAMRVINQGFTEGLQNVYRYSEAMGSMDSANTKNSLDQISSSLAYLKNSIGAAVAPLIQSLVPVLQTVVGWAVNAANAINMFISALQGKSTYTKAKENAVGFLNDVKKSAGGAAKAAKDATKTLLGFDEINKLNAPTSGAGGGGGGGGSAATNYGDMFEEAAVDLGWLDTVKQRLGDILEFAIMIGAAIAGWKLGTALSKLLGFDLGQTVKFAAGLALALAGATAEFLGLKSVLEDGVNLGNTLESIFGAVAFIIGGALMGSAFGLAGVFASIAAIIAGVPMYVVGIVDAVKEGLNWMNGLLITIGATLGGAGIGGVIGAIAGTIGGPQGAAIGAAIGLWIGLVTDLIIGVVDLIKNWDDLKASMSDVAFGAKAGAMFGGLIGIFFGPGVAAVYASIGAEFGALIGMISELDIQSSDLWKDISTGATNAYNTIVDTFSPLTTFFSNAFTDIKSGILTVWSDVSTAAVTAWNWISSTVSKVWGDIKTGAINAFNTIKAGLQPLITWAVNTFNSFKQTVSEIWYNISVIFTGVLAVIKEAASRAFEWAKVNIITPLAEKLTAVWEKLKTGASKAWEGIKSVFGTVAEWFASTFGGAWERVKKVFSVGGAIFKGIAEGISSAFKKIVNSLISGINNVVRVPFNAINNALDKLRNANILGLQPFAGLRSITVPTIPYMAEGGFVPGDLFVANDAGPELVGTVNRRTAVASNGEITGIADAVYNTGSEEASLLRTQNDLLRRLLAKEMTAVVSADSIVAGLARKNRRDGASTVALTV